MTYLDHARRALQATLMPEEPVARARRPAPEWVADRNYDILDSQNGDLPLPEPEPLQRDLFK